METKTFLPIKIWFFTNFSSNLATNINNSYGNIFFYDYLGGMVGNCLYLKPAAEEEVINTVKAGKRNKSTDWLSSRMKIAKIKPVLKSGAKMDIGN